MNENYIGSMERFKDMINSNEKYAEKHMERYEHCLSVVNSLGVLELEKIYYLRLIDCDNELMPFFKELYELKVKFKEQVLTAFNLWQLVEPYDYDKFEKEAKEEFKQINKLSHNK